LSTELLYTLISCCMVRVAELWREEVRRTVRIQWVQSTRCIKATLVSGQDFHLRTSRRSTWHTVPTGARLVH